MILANGMHREKSGQDTPLSVLTENRAVNAGGEENEAGKGKAALEVGKTGQKGRKMMLKIVLLVLCFFASMQAQTIYYPNPGDVGSIKGCLFTNGHRDYTTGVAIYWYGEFTTNTGWHYHDDYTPPPGRPTMCLTFTGGCTVYQPTLTTYTNQGCSTIQVKQSWYAGQYYLNTTVPPPYTTSLSVTYVTGIISGIGPPFSSSNYNFSTDTDHNNHQTYGNTVVLNDMLAAANSLHSLTGGSPLTVMRVGLPNGGFLDTFKYWTFQGYPNLAEMHEDAQEFDAVLIFGTDSQIRTAIQAGHCTPSLVPNQVSLYHAACS